MNLGKIFKYLLWGSITLLFVGGFLWNCTFAMDKVKHPTRMSCGVSQYVNAVQYIFGKIFNHRMEKAENRIENLQKTMSGNTSN